MAKIRKIINDDIYLSLKIAIQAENIAYSRFVNQFFELWGRMSVRYWGVEWDKSMAYKSIDGQAVYGDEFVPLFFDGSVDFEYTKRMCKLLGIDYDELFSQRGEVDYFKIDLMGIKLNNVGFKDAAVVRNTYSEFVELLIPHNINKFKVSFVLDSEIATNAHVGMSLAEARAATLHVDRGDLTYLYDTKPSVSYFTLPTYNTITTQSEPDADGNVQTTTTYEEVEGVAIYPNSAKMDNVLSLMAAHLDILDIAIGAPSFEMREIASRVVVDEYGYEYVFARYECVLTYDFGSHWDFGDTQNIELVNNINWGGLSSQSFADEFAGRMSSFEGYYVPADYNYQMAAEWHPNTPKDAYVFALLILNLAEFEPVSDLFYTYLYDYGGLAAASFEGAWFRRDIMGTMKNRELAEIILKSINLTYKKKKDGWLDGNLLGRILEVAFVLVVTVVGISFGPIGVMIATVVLALAVKYTGMSANGAGFAMFGIKVLAVAGIYYGVDAIYTSAYEDATTQAIADNLSDSAIDAGVATSVNAATSVGVAETLVQLGIVEVAQLVSFAMSFANIMLPPQSSDAQQPTQEAEAENHGMYSVDATYDLYDNYLGIYEYA